MTTRSQANELVGRSIRRLCAEYEDFQPIVVRAVVRSIVGEAKTIGTAAAMDAARAVLKELYKDSTGREALNNRDFRKWVQGALHAYGAPATGIPAHPVNNVDIDDAFDAPAGAID